MIRSDPLVEEVRSALGGGAGYLSAADILDRLERRAALVAELGSRERAIEAVKKVLLEQLRAELSFDFTTGGVTQDIVFRLRG